MKTGSIKFERNSTALGAYSTRTNDDASRITISQCMGGSGLLQDSGIAHHNSNKQCADMLAEGSSLNPGSRPSLNNPTGLHMALTSSASQNRMDVLQDNPSNPRLRLASPGSSNTVPGSAKGGAVVQAVHDCPLKNTSSEEEGHCAITTTSRTSSFSYESDHYVGVATDQPTNGPRANPRASGSAPMPLLSTALTSHQQQQPRPDLQLPMNAHPPDSSTSGRSLQAHPPASRDHFQQSSPERPKATTDSSTNNNTALPSALISSTCSTASEPESINSSDEELDLSPKKYTGPAFFFDTGATSSFGGLKTPLDSTKPCFRQVRGINSHCVARIQGPCMAIPNVALSKDFKKNLASVSQLTKAHGDQISFDQHHVYAGQSIPPGSHPAGTSIVGHATSSGLYHMDMDAYQRHVATLKNHSSQANPSYAKGSASREPTPSPTVLAAGEARQHEHTDSSCSTAAHEQSTTAQSNPVLDRAQHKNSTLPSATTAGPSHQTMRQQTLQQRIATCDAAFAKLYDACIRANENPPPSTNQRGTQNRIETSNYIGAPPERQPTESKHQELHFVASNSTEGKASQYDQALPVADYRPAENAMLLHTRMGHAPKKVMMDALKQGITLGVPITLQELTHSNIYCRACAASKQNKKPYPRKSKTPPSDTILGLIHTDTAGPRPRSIQHQNRLGHSTGRFKYWQVYVDDHSKYLWVDFLSSKGHLPARLKRMCRTMEMDARNSKHAPPAGEMPLRVKAFRSDNAGELTSKQVVAQLHKAMIDHERTVPNSSSQNAHAESAIKVIQDMARTYLDSANFPLKYWPFAIRCATYTINRLPSSIHPRMCSRYEQFYGKKPDYKHLKTFGAVVTKWLPISKRKHGDKQSPAGQGGTRHRLVGYPRKSKGYLVFDTEFEPRPRVFSCRNIHLQENVEEFPDLDSSDDSTSGSSSESEFSSDSSLNLSGFDSASSHSDSSSSEQNIPDQLAGVPEENQTGSESDAAPSCGAPDSSAEERLDSSTPDELTGSSSDQGIDNGHRVLIKSRPKDTVNKIARRHGCNAQLLCNMNDGIAKDRALRPTDHLRTKTELYLPTQSDEERYEASKPSSDSNGSSSDTSSASNQPSGPQVPPEQPAAAAPPLGRAPAPGSAQANKAQDAQAHSALAVRSKSATMTSQANSPHAVESKSAASSFLHYLNENKSDEALMSLATPLSSLTEIASAYTCADKEQDIMEEAYYLKLAKCYAATPTCDAHDSSMHLIEKICDYICPPIRLALQSHVGDDSEDQTLKAVFDRGYRLFQHAYAMEEAHLIEALKHIPAREIPSPKNHAEAMRSQYQEFWNDAVAAELANLKSYNVYKLEKLPPGCRPINSRFVFKVKPNQQGLVDRLKARLVVQGFRQRYGIDYLKTHASVCKLATFRYQMALAAQLDMLHDILDVKSAYLEADMKMPVYINIPGIETPPGMGHRLIKSLYGTKQAGHNWHETIVPKLINEWGFQQSIADACMFSHHTSLKDFCILCLFVDDFSITSTRGHTKSRDHFIKQLNKVYKTSRSDDSNVYLGIRCRRLATHQMFLDQELYVTQFLHAYGFSNTRPVSTPTSGAILNKEQCPTEASEKKSMALYPYRQIVGSLRYLEHCTRPDIAFALNRLSRYQANPGLAHWNELKHLVRYVAGTKHHGISFGRDCYPQHIAMNHDLSGPLTCFVDSDYAADRDKRRSCTGYVFFSRGGPISWRSRLQSSTALSTTEAEFMAASDAGCENVWLRRLIGDTNNLTCTRLNGILCAKDIAAPKLSTTFYDHEVPTLFHEDNMGCIQCSEHPVLHGRMKHIDIKYHRLKEFVQNGDCKLVYVDTKRQIADLLTKALTKSIFIPLRDCLVIDPFAISPRSS